MKEKENKLEKIDVINIIIVIIEAILLVIEIVLEKLNNKLTWIPLIIMLSVWLIYDYINNFSKEKEKKHNEKV